MNLATEIPNGVSSEGVTASEMEFQSYNRICKTLIQRMMSEVSEVRHEIDLTNAKATSKKRLDLVEIMCSPDSELTKHVLRQDGLSLIHI